MTNKELVLAFLDAADRNDVATVKTLFGPNHMFFTTMSPVPMTTDQHLEMMHAFKSGFSNSNHEVADIMECDDKITVRGFWQGVHTGDFNGIPASGKPVRLSYIMIFEVSGQELVNQWIEMDGMNFMMQIGAMPAAHSA